MSEITNEMKAKCMGEFKLSYEDICPKCVLGDDSPCMCNSDQNGVFTNTRAVPWDLCKQIFKTMYALSPAAAESAALKEENERLKEKLSVSIVVEESYEARIKWANDRASAMEARVAELEGNYNDLLMCVQNKIPGVTRHDRAKQCILNWETGFSSSQHRERCDQGASQ